MKDETKKWLDYADENLESAKVLLESELFNPCLQNVQQFVEKMLKAVFIELSIKFRKTHSINELVYCSRLSFSVSPRVTNFRTRSYGFARGNLLP